MKDEAGLSVLAIGTCCAKAGVVPATNTRASRIFCMGASRWSCCRLTRPWPVSQRGFRCQRRFGVATLAAAPRGRAGVREIMSRSHTALAILVVLLAFLAVVLGLYGLLVWRRSDVALTGAILLLGLAQLLSI